MVVMNDLCVKILKVFELIDKLCCKNCTVRCHVDGKIKLRFKIAIVKMTIIDILMGFIMSDLIYTETEWFGKTTREYLQSRTILFLRGHRSQYSLDFEYPYFRLENLLSMYIAR
jgi:hypothetical protein